MSDFEEYKQRVIEDIRTTVGSRPVQPVIFAGSGLSKRYFSAPGWDDLLKEMAGACPKLEHNYGYYRQTNSAPEMGSLLADHYAQWAWDKNESKFSDWDLDYKESPDIYIKSEVANLLEDITPNSSEELSEDRIDDNLTISEAKRELSHLVDIQPHAIITTNYDEFLEKIFNQDEVEEESYLVVVGEKIIESQHRNVGEILKIHGSITDPETLVLTSEDYSEFNTQKRYLSSKMLTYFAEHPLLIVGYSASDSNVRQILSWMNQLLPDGEVVAEDIYFLEYEEDVIDLDTYPTEKRIQIGKDRYISIKGIVARDFDWVFKSFASGEGFEVDIPTLRKILANTYEVVRSKTPEAKVVDHQRVGEVSEDTEKLATVLGISANDDDLSFEFDHDYSPNEVYDMIGIGSTYEFKNKILKPIYSNTNINITEFNNKYHIAFFDRSVEYRSYSDAAIELFEKILNNQEFELNIPEERIPEEIPEDYGLDLDAVLDSE